MHFPDTIPSSKDIFYQRYLLKRRFVQAEREWLAALRNVIDNEIFAKDAKPYYENYQEAKMALIKYQQEHEHEFHFPDIVKIDLDKPLNWDRQPW